MLASFSYTHIWRVYCPLSISWRGQSVRQMSLHKEQHPLKKSFCNFFLYVIDNWFQRIMPACTCSLLNTYFCPKKNAFSKASLNLSCWRKRFYILPWSTHFSILLQLFHLCSYAAIQPKDTICWKKTNRNTANQSGLAQVGFWLSHKHQSHNTQES